MSRLRKVFIDKVPAGQGTQYWEQQWATLDLDKAQCRSESDFLFRLLAANLSGVDDPVLEAGCGSGIVAVSLAGLGRCVVGLDLARDALGRAVLHWPDFRAIAGDVADMPFSDRTFGAVVSLGVLEHAESGPLSALREHRRVLRDDGVLLVTVPRISPLKAIRDMWNLRLRGMEFYSSRNRWVARRNEPGAERSDRVFHQYEFQRSYWHAMLVEAGFSIASSHPHMVGAGLGDMTFLRHLGLPRDLNDDGLSSSSSSSLEKPPESGILTRWKTAIGNESPQSSVERGLVRAAQSLVGHMLLTVARPA